MSKEEVKALGKQTASWNSKVKVTKAAENQWEGRKMVGQISRHDR